MSNATHPPAEDGAAQDGAAQDEGAQDRAARPRGPRLVVGGLVFLVVSVGTWFLAKAAFPPRPQPQPERPAGLAFLNLGSDAQYVGNDACRQCHAPRYESWKATNHSRSLGPIDPSEEPLPGTFEHALSGLLYDMYERDGRMYMRESIPFEGGKLALTDHPLQWLVGSGAHSRTYGTELDGFLVESPATYYMRRKLWDVSPGYDRDVHLGFARPMGYKCLRCHVGRMEREGLGIQQVKFHELAIGCESCHGPGSLHGAKQRGAVPGPAGSASAADLTIVNPKRLEREQLMDLCADCHMDNTLTVVRPGHTLADWRPGAPITDSRVTFRPKVRETDMTVVGHVDQLRLSRCFQASDTMTCVTCHDPHYRPPPEEREAWFRARCLTCHEPEACGMDSEHRLEMSATDSCMVCHMPRGDTDIPHIAFTHHRIGIHRPGEEDQPRFPSRLELEPVGDVSHISSAERDRNLGLAYHLLTVTRPLPSEQRQEALTKAEALLRTARDKGGLDIEGSVVLASILDTPKDRDKAFELAEQLNRDLPPKMSADARVHLLAIRAKGYMGVTKHKEALACLLELTKLRRDPLDWNLLTVVYRDLEDKEGALRAARKAVEIVPHWSDLQFELARVYEWIGNEEMSARHNKIGGQLVKMQTERHGRVPKKPR